MTDAATTVSTINAAIQDPIPQMQDVPDTTVHLLCGLRAIDGTLQTEAVVREMNGGDEEFLAALEGKSALSYPEYMAALLKRTVLSIGDLNIQQNPNLIDDLVVPDRDILFLAVVKATYGNIRRFTITCPHCANTSDLNVNIDEDFPLQGTPEEARKPIVVTLKSGEKVTLRLPTCGDTKFVMKKGKTIPEQNTLMIARCADVLVADKEQWARNLNIGDRNALRDALLDVELGPKAGEVNDPCPNCGETINVALDWVGLLFG